MEKLAEHRSSVRMRKRVSKNIPAHCIHCFHCFSITIFPARAKRIHNIPLTVCPGGVSCHLQMAKGTDRVEGSKEDTGDGDASRPYCSDTHHVACCREQRAAAASFVLVGLYKMLDQLIYKFQWRSSGRIPIGGREGPSDGWIVDREVEQTRSKIGRLIAGESETEARDGK